MTDEECTKQKTCKRFQEIKDLPLHLQYCEYTPDDYGNCEGYVSILKGSVQGSGNMGVSE